MLALLVDGPFDDPGYIFEAKYDGYRAIAGIDAKGKVDLYSRNFISFNEKFAPIAKELKKISHQAIIDGEVVVENAKGVSCFQLLQNYQRGGGGVLKYYVFDLLHLDGVSTRELTLLERKQLLQSLLKKSKLKNILYSDHIERTGKKYFKYAEKHDWEGIIAKEAASPYRPGKRSGEWKKIKLSKEQEAIIIGITTPQGSRKYFGSLLLGAYVKGKLTYIGNCGAGFTEATLKELYQKFTPYFISESPVTERVVRREAIQWIKPKFVAQVRFTEWTGDLSLRHPVFVGLRLDKKPKEVIPEIPKHIKH